MIKTNKTVGEGAFGVVKKAFDTKLPNKELVVKIMQYDNETKR